MMFKTLLIILSVVGYVSA